MPPANLPAPPHSDNKATKRPSFVPVPEHHSLDAREKGCRSFAHPTRTALGWSRRDGASPLSQEVIHHFSELFRLDRPGWTFPGWGCWSFGKKTADMPEDVVDCCGVSMGANVQPVTSTAHSR